MMKINLIITLCALGIYAVILVIFAILINRAKKNLPDSSSVRKPGSSFWWVFIVALFLILLPILMPMTTKLILLVCGCGILGEFIVLKDRLELLNKSIREESPTVEMPPENE